MTRCITFVAFQTGWGEKRFSSPSEKILVPINDKSLYLRPAPSPVDFAVGLGASDPSRSTIFFDRKGSDAWPGLFGSGTAPSSVAVTILENGKLLGQVWLRWNGRVKKCPGRIGVDWNLRA